MAIKDDIISLVGWEKTAKKTLGRFVQGLSTPGDTPAIGNIVSFTKLIKPPDESVEIPFNPTTKDYQFRVDVWSAPDGEDGFIVTAKRSFGDGVVEAIVYKSLEATGE